MAFFDKAEGFRTGTSNIFRDESNPAAGSGFEGLHGAYVDQTEALYGGMGQYIMFEHVPTGTRVFFKAFLKTFKDTYDSRWNATAGYGRMDDIQVFQKTGRNISISFDVVAATVLEAKDNMIKLSTLTQMLYPTFDTSGGVQTIKAAPLLKLKFMNWAQNSEDGTGILGACKGLSFNPNLQPGVFTVWSKTKGNLIYPKVFTIDTSLTVIHEHRLGWRIGEKSVTNAKSGKKEKHGTYVSQANNFPYGELIQNVSSKPHEKKVKNKDLLAAQHAAVTKEKQCQSLFYCPKPIPPSAIADK